MKQEDKELLLKDLCARLPYGITCSIYRIDDLDVGWRDEKLSGYFYNGISYEFYFGESPISIDNDISKIKPYLRPLSSMTEEEKNEFIHYAGYEVEESVNGRHYEYYLKDYVGTPEKPSCNCDAIDWLNKHHFDCRRLIDKGLALEAPEGMYK